MITYRLEGLKEVQRAFDKRLKAVKQTTPRALSDVALDLLSQAVQRAPVDTGDLRGSGSALLNGREIAHGEENGNITRTGGGIGTGLLNLREHGAVVRFTEPYAVVQHERLDFQHPKGGEAKYLERPFVENADKYLDHLRDAVKEAIEDGAP